MSRSLTLTLVGAILAFGVLAAPALADLPVYTTVNNDTDYSVSLQASSGGESCWNDDDFSDGGTVAANSSFTYYSSIRDNNDDCVSAPGAPDAHIYLDLTVQQPDGSYLNPFTTAQGNMLSSGPDYSSTGNLELFYHNTSNHYLYPYNSPGNDQWVPASPVLSGSSGSGMFCVSWTQSYYTGTTYQPVVDIEPEQNCPTTSDGPPATDASASSAAYRAPAATAAQTTTTGEVFNLLPMLQGECDLFVNSSYCPDISDNDDWDLQNITGTVNDFEATEPPPTTYAWGALNPAELEQDNQTGREGTLDYTFQYTEGEQDTTSTTSGYEVGNTVTFGTNTGPANDQISSEYNFSSTDAQQSGSQSQTSVSASVNTQAGGTTYLYGFQGTGSQAFNYTANLTFGDQTGNADPLITPAPGVLSYSPATSHPCIGYLVGDSTVSGSAMQAYAQSQALGDTAEDPNFNSYEQAFLSGAAGFNASSSACPGYPSGFASGAGFDGSGTMDASVLGGTGVSETSWYPDLGSIVTCAYFDTTDTDPTNPDTPCAPPTTSSFKAPGGPGGRAAAASGQVPGNVVKSSDHKRGARLVGTQRSVLMIGAPHDHDTLITGPGTFNVVRGASGGETLVARGKTDVLNAGPGGDRITGGPGYDSIYGGRGDDRITAGPGTGAAHGGVGDDVLRSGPRSASGLFGDGGDDSLVVHGTPRVAVYGGRGDDTYHLFGAGATRSVFEAPRAGRDTLDTDHSMAMPQNIEIGRSSGPGIKLTGVRTTQGLAGNRHDDTLIAGPGNERLSGGAGDDKVQLAAAGFDTATGGPGADRFIVAAVPFKSWRAKPRKHFTSHRITDFRPQQRDRLVLKAKYYGAQLMSRRLTLEQRPGARATTPNPTILFDPDADLVRFDPDGSGPEVPRLVARLDRFRCTGSSGPSGRVHTVRGAHCLPASAITITR